MPSGRTHDSITLWSLPLVAGLTFERTRDSSVTLMVATGFLVGGLMFGPDLDIYSRQYQRWGVLRWIWLPYRRGMRHRSFLSHGPIVGTMIRLLYLLVWLAALALGWVLISTIAAQLLGIVDQWDVLAQAMVADSTAFMGRSLQQHRAMWIALVIGLELGALSHSLCDGAEFAYKRLVAKSNPRSRKAIKAKVKD